jgi:hypothetical protein
MLRELLKWALRRRYRYRVSGDSMHPDLVDGEIILISPSTQVRVNSIVVCGHPWKQIDVVKWVRGHDTELIDLWSPQGTHSQHFGRADAELVRGVATASLSRRCLLPNRPTSPAKDTS